MSSILALPALADSDTDVNVQVTAADISEDATEVNAATAEATTIVRDTGMLIEVGNTTAEQTTIIVRTDSSGTQTDVTLEITSATVIVDHDGGAFDLSNLIAGDNLSYTADLYENSGQLVARRIVVNNFRREHRAGPHNGWVTEVRADEQKILIEWDQTTYTLNLQDARIVAGVKNPAVISDIQVGDRVRFRGIDDGDGDTNTWDTKMLVVLRRGDALFMRVTRWVVEAEIVALPDDLSLPAVLEVSVLPSKFFQKNDVNNRVGAPGTVVSVLIDEDTKLLRRYYGQALLKEFSEGDRIRIIGRLNEQTGQLEAQYVKNNQVQRLGVATKLGEVIAVNDTSGEITITLLSQGSTDQTVIIRTDADTEIEELGEAVSFATVQVGDHVRVRGVVQRGSDSVLADEVRIVVYRDELPESDDIDELRAQYHEHFEQFKAELDQRRDTLKQQLREHRDELREQLDQMRDQLKQRLREVFGDDSSDDNKSDDTSSHSSDDLVDDSDDDSSDDNDTDSEESQDTDES